MPMIPVPGASKTPFPKPPPMLQRRAPCGTPQQWSVSGGLMGSLVIAEPVAGPNIAPWQTDNNTFGHGPMHLYDDPPRTRRSPRLRLASPPPGTQGSRYSVPFTRPSQRIEHGAALVKLQPSPPPPPDPKQAVSTSPSVYLRKTRENSRNALWADESCVDCPKGEKIHVESLW